MDLALPQLLRDCREISPQHSEAIGAQVRALMVTAERTMKHPEDLEPVRARASALLAAVGSTA